MRINNIKILSLIATVVCSIYFSYNVTNSDLDESTDFIQKIESINFKPIINTINTEKYTLESDKIFKKAYLKVLNNILPVTQAASGENIFLKDLIRGKELTNNEFENFIKKFVKYRYMDFDNDGLPELIFEIDGPVVLKYAQEENLIYLHYYNYDKWHILGSGQVYYLDSTSANKLTYIYQLLDNNTHVIESVSFEVYSEYNKNTKKWFKNRFITFNDYDKKLIDEDLWDKTTKTFFESINSEVSYKTFEELFY